MYTYAPYTEDEYDEDEYRYDKPPLVLENTRQVFNPFFEDDNDNQYDDEVSIKMYTSSIELSTNLQSHVTPLETDELSETLLPKDVFDDIETSPIDPPETTFESYFRIHNQEDYDVFFERVYEYFYRGGWIPWITRVIFEFIVSIVAGGISILVLRCIDWGTLLHCSQISTNECRDMVTFINIQWIISPTTDYDRFMITYLIVLCVYFGWALVLIPGRIIVAKKMRILYETFLNISYEDLRVITWEEIVNKLTVLQQEKGINLQLPETLEQPQNETTKDPLMESLGVDGSGGGGGSGRSGGSGVFKTADDVIRLRITWFDTLWKHLITNVLGGIQWKFRLPLTIRAFYSGHLRHKTEPPRGEDDYRLVNDTPDEEYWYIQVGIPFTTTMETYMKPIIRNLLFTRDRVVSSSFTSVNLRMIMIVYGLVLLICLPFMILYVCVFWILNVIEQSKNRKYIVGKPYWKYEARWQFYKEYELPHEMEHRLDAAMRVWEDYSRMFRHPIYSLVRQSLGYIGGSVLSVLLVISILVDESVLLTTELWGRPLYWYIVVLTGGVMAIRGDGRENDKVSLNEYVSLGNREGFREKILEIRRFLGGSDLLSDRGDVGVVGDGRVDSGDECGGEYTLRVKHMIEEQVMSEPVRILWEILTMIFLPFFLIFYFPTKATDIVLETREKLGNDISYGAFVSKM
jgi:hypothetical protein